MRHVVQPIHEEFLRSGNYSFFRGVVEFLKEALVEIPGLDWIRVVRADPGFFDLCKLMAIVRK